MIIIIFFRQEDLHQVLKAYSLYDTDVGYCQVIFLQELFFIAIYLIDCVIVSNVCYLIRRVYKHYFVIFLIQGYGPSICCFTDAHDH